ncbi:PREDICTED: kinesin-like protein KIF18A [Amphimedon queenslandica]|uniref:Kinesin motor domain-containing protein n=1 Tax=Amphimedon queenslandica TaxID=400682 RepID=A0A1X7ULA3_AMPQE|nr:PREDICTED: kinesin-like protein KIF18A [Amphimedon queenslandica]|eukprot:XP_003387534.1 PREDICTED: kinesin-like protein KIF18A [Amphimedon queenslandica]
MFKRRPLSLVEDSTDGGIAREGGSNGVDKERKGSEEKEYEITDTGNTNMRVIVRVRPENESEIRSNCETIIRQLDEHVLVFDPKQDNMPQFEERGGAGGGARKRRPFLSKKHKDLRFAFDRIFDETSSQQEVFETTTKPILDGLLDGVNCSVFAYGATGAGKTYTMLGNEEEPGIMFLTTMELYRRIERLKSVKICDVAVTYLEIYNETIRDLLEPSGALAMREDGRCGLVVSGLSQHQPKSAEELLQMLADGNKNRTQHPTDANATSSRSHAVFQVYVNQRARSGGLTAEVTQGKLSLIDLAGSERATVTTNRGARMREGANINRSLLALGNCINALAANKGKLGHVPYRNSKLTRLLKDSLGGNCRTVMIANISPSGLTYEDTYNTLRYADRAKQIKTKLVRNVVNVDYHVTRYRTIVIELQKEIVELKSQLKTSPTTLPATVSSGSLCLFDEETEKIKENTSKIYMDRAGIRKAMADLDAVERDTLLRIFRKEKDLERIEVLTGNDRRIAKIKSKLEYLHSRLRDVKQQKTSLHQQLSTNNEKIEQFRTQINYSSCSDDVSKYVEAVTENSKLDSECSYQWRQTKHLLRYIKNQEKEISRTEKVFLLTLELVRKQYQLLQATNCLTPVVRDLFDSLTRQIDGEKEVLWANSTITDDSLCNVSVSSFTATHQALFDTIVSHSSPIKKGNTAGSRYSSPTSSASLGILTRSSDPFESETMRNREGSGGRKVSQQHPLSERRVAVSGKKSTESVQSSDSSISAGSCKVLSTMATSPSKKKRVLFSPSPAPSDNEDDNHEKPIIKRTTQIKSQNDAPSAAKKSHLNLAQLTSISKPYPPSRSSLSPAPPLPAHAPTIRSLPSFSNNCFEDNFVQRPPESPVTPSNRQATPTQAIPFCVSSGGFKLPLPRTTPTSDIKSRTPFNYPPPPLAAPYFSPAPHQHYAPPTFNNPLSLSNSLTPPMQCVASLNYNVDTPPVPRPPDKRSTENFVSNPIYMTSIHSNDITTDEDSLNTTYIITKETGSGRSHPLAVPNKLSLNSIHQKGGVGGVAGMRGARKNKKSPVKVPIRPLAELSTSSNEFNSSGDINKPQPRYLSLTKSAAIKRQTLTRSGAFNSSHSKENHPFNRSTSHVNKNSYIGRLQPPNRSFNPRSQSTST